MVKHIPLDIDEEDFIVKIHPHRDKDFRWTGDVTLGILTSQDNPLTDDDYYYMMEFTNLICATVPMMSDNPDFKEEIEAYVEEEKNIKKYSDKKTKKYTTKTSGNVITVKFSDKIDGSA